MNKTEGLTFEEIRYVPGIYQYQRNDSYLLIVVPPEYSIFHPDLKSRNPHPNCRTILCLKNGQPIVFDAGCGLTDADARYEKKENLDYKFTLFLKE